MDRLAAGIFIQFAARGILYRNGNFAASVIKCTIIDDITAMTKGLELLATAAAEFETRTMAGH